MPHTSFSCRLFIAGHADAAAARSDTPLAGATLIRHGDAASALCHADAAIWRDAATMLRCSRHADDDATMLVARRAAEAAAASARYVFTDASATCHAERRHYALCWRHAAQCGTQNTASASGTSACRVNRPPAAAVARRASAICVRDDAPMLCQERVRVAQDVMRQRARVMMRASFLMINEHSSEH